MDTLLIALKPYTDESFWGYLNRLTHENFYDGVDWPRLCFFITFDISGLCNGFLGPSV